MSYILMVPKPEQVAAWKDYVIAHPVSHDDYAALENKHESVLVVGPDYKVVGTLVNDGVDQWWALGITAAESKRPLEEKELVGLMDVLGFPPWERKDGFYYRGSEPYIYHVFYRYTPDDPVQTVTE